MSPVFVDTNVPMYAGGGPHPVRDAAQRAILALATGEIDGVTDAEVFQEILYRYLHIGDRVRGFRIFDDFYRIMAGRILPVEAADTYQARMLADHYTGLSPRDLIHLAVARRHGISEIMTADRGFDAVSEIRRLDLSEFLAPDEPDG